MKILKESTKSLCNECSLEIKAKVFEEDHKVFIEKVCPIHGKQSAIIEKDVDCYKRFAQIDQESTKGYYASLVIPVTYKCNTQCSFCYIPCRDKADISIKKFNEIVAKFEGKIIVLSGGEPTMRADLPRLIESVIQNKKYPILQTNGLKLNNEEYVKVLKKAGLERIHFSFDGFDSKVYKLIKGSETHLQKKLQALENLKKHRFLVLLGTTIYKGINENEIANILEYIYKQGSFIYQLRLRSCVEVGKFEREIPPYYLSDMVDLFSKALNIQSSDLYKFYLCRHSQNSMHHVDFKMFYHKKGALFFSRPLISRMMGKGYFISYKILKILGLYKYLDKFIWALPQRDSVLPRINVRIIAWPNIKNIDLNEVDRGIAHLYDEKILNFCHAVVLNQKL